MIFIKKIIKFFIRKIRSNIFLRSLLAEEAKTAKKYKVFNKFIDNNKNTNELLEGYRDAMQPGWKNALSPLNSLEFPNQDAIEKSVLKAKKLIEDSVVLLNNFNFDFEEKRILEFGCNDGSKTCALANLGPKEVFGSDISYYYVLDRKDDSISNKSFNENEYLSKLRNIIIEKYLTKSAKCNPKYLEDNICDSNFKSNFFDLIFSWNVLEHIQRPKEAIKEMYRILVSGGIVFNKYNPFFCQGGVHSLCTLDFPWGHVWLNKF